MELSDSSGSEDKGIVVPPPSHTADHSEETKMEVGEEAEDVLPALQHFLELLETGQGLPAEIAVSLYNINIEDTETAVRALQAFEVRLFNLGFTLPDVCAKRYLLLLLNRTYKLAGVPPQAPFALVHQQLQLVLDVLQTSTDEDEMILYAAELLQTIVFYRFDDKAEVSLMLGSVDQPLMGQLATVFSKIMRGNAHVTEYFFAKMAEVAYLIAEDLAPTFMDDRVKANFASFFHPHFLQTLPFAQTYRCLLIFAAFVNSRMSFSGIDTQISKQIVQNSLPFFLERIRQVSAAVSSFQAVDPTTQPQESVADSIGRVVGDLKETLREMVSVFEGPFLQSVVALSPADLSCKLLQDFCSLLVLHDNIFTYLSQDPSDESQSALKRYLKGLAFGYCGLTNCLQIFDERRLLSAQVLLGYVERTFLETKRSFLACSKIKAEPVLVAACVRLIEAQLRSLNRLLETDLLEKDAKSRTMAAKVLSLDELINILDFCLANHGIFHNDLILLHLELTTFTIAATKTDSWTLTSYRDLISKVA